MWGRGHRGDVHVGHEQDAAIQASLSLPGPCVGRVGEGPHRLHAQIVEEGGGARDRLLDPHGVRGGARHRHPVPEPALDHLPALGHEAHRVGARVDPAGVEDRRFGSTEVAGARDLDQAVDERREVEAQMSRPDEIGAALGQAREAVGLEDVEASLPLEAHVDTGAVLQPEGLEGPDRNLLGPAADLLPDRRRADVLDDPSASTGLVLVAIDRGAIAESQLHRRKRLRGVVPEEADVDLPAFDELLDEDRLLVFVEDHPGRLAQLALVVDHLEPERHRFVPGLDDHRIGEPGDRGIRGVHHREVRRGKAVLLEDHLRHDLVEGQRVPHRPRGHIRDAHHLQDARHVRVARLALQTVGHVEDHARAFSLHDPRHEILELLDQILVALEGDHLMTALAERIGEAADGLHADLLAVRHAEEVDDVLAVPVVDDGHLHPRGSPARILASSCRRRGLPPSGSPPRQAGRPDPQRHRGTSPPATPRS